MAKDRVRLAAVGDLHCTKAGQGSLRSLVAQANAAADVLLLCGDLTDYGLVEEARVLVEELAGLTIPVVAVLGNHDFESGQQAAIRTVLEAAGVTLLDGEACEVHGIGFAGVKGFAGGFAPYALTAWGEQVIKDVVREGEAEGAKLAAALAQLQTPQRVAVLHYAPIRATVEGEAPEIFAYMGSSHLEEALNGAAQGRAPVTVALHGHAHAGAHAGRTQTGVPVYNVSLPVLLTTFPDGPPFLLLDLPVAGT
jgi:Icc-related predicted phosphoesterase